MYIVIGTSVVRVVATFDSPDEAAALASRWNDEDKGEGHMRRDHGPITGPAQRMYALVADAAARINPNPFRVDV